MAEYQKKLNFSLKELVPFRADQLVREIKSASLEPNVICHEHGQYVILRGKLVFCGEYYPQNYEIQEDFFAEQNVADVFRNNENGHCTFNYAFPVDITIPQDRILSTDEISIGINNFDCSVQEDGFVKVSAELFVDGVYDREYVEHVRYQNQILDPVAEEIPAFNVTEEFNKGANFESQFETSQDFTQNQEFQAGNSENHYAEFRNNQGEQWNKAHFEQQENSPNHAYDGQYINSDLHQNEYNASVDSKESYDEQIKYHTTYDYDPWNHNFNTTNTYSQADYYRNPYDATFQGGAGTQYYNQPNEKIENSDSNSLDADSEFIDQYVKFSPSHKPEFVEIENSDYDIKFIPEDSAEIRSEDTQMSYETPISDKSDSNLDVTVTQDHSYENHHEFSSETTHEEDSKDSHFKSAAAINQHEVELEIEKPTAKRTEGYDKVVFPFSDDENAFGKTDEYEFIEENHSQPKMKPVQESSKQERPEIGKSRVVSDFFNVRGKEEKSSCLKIYIVQRGDSLEQLAEKYSTNASKIAHYNQLQLNDKILEGQVIYIPE